MTEKQPNDQGPRQAEPRQDAHFELESTKSLRPFDADDLKAKINEAAEKLHLEETLKIDPAAAGLESAEPQPRLVAPASPAVTDEARTSPAEGRSVDYAQPAPLPTFLELVVILGLLAIVIAGFIVFYRPLIVQMLDVMWRGLFG